MIEKMKFVSLTGPKDDIDRVALTYLSGLDIHLENALTAMGPGQKLTPFIENNPYREDMTLANEFADRIPAERQRKAKKVKAAPIPDVSYGQALETVRGIKSRLDDMESRLETLKNESTSLSDVSKVLDHFSSLDFDIDTLLQFRHLHFRFGKMPVECEHRFNEYVNEREMVHFLKCDADREYAWGIVFMPESEVNRIRTILTTLRFEKTYIPGKYKGTAKEICQGISEDLSRNEKESRDLSAAITALFRDNATAIRAAQKTLSGLFDSFDIRRQAALSVIGENTYYVLCGWLGSSDIPAFEKTIEEDPYVICSISEDAPYDDLVPPTKLKNPALFKPYEMYTEMYGLPNYTEFDPTIFIALTYSFIFGAMFGDAGQGLCLLIGGFLLYKLKGVRLGGIIGLAGIFSTFFGFMFGSFFGFENVLPALWLRPREAMLSLPLVGRLNTVFIVAIVFGMGLILLTMIFNIVLSKRRKDVAEAYFGTNSVSGIIFYGTVVFLIIMVMSGHTIPAAGIFLGIIAITVLMMFLKEPLTKMVEHSKEKKIEGGIGMFIVQGFFELFEVMLSFFSNTLSFVRIGAFAVSHAAMMGVVLMLAGAEAGNPNWIAVILGNIFVMGLEGLIVGIQVLRLEYYELFSRFYKGDGKSFRSFRKNRA